LVRRVCRNVKRWRDASMALRWTAAAMLEAAKGLRKLKAKSQLPQLCAALSAHRQKADPAFSVAQTQQAAYSQSRAPALEFQHRGGHAPTAKNPKKAKKEGIKSKIESVSP
jgi:hypothetical protein